MLHVTDVKNETNHMSLCSKGPKLLPDHQEAHQPVSDPQETGQEQHTPLLHCCAVCRRRPAHVQELRYV